MSLLPSSYIERAIRAFNYFAEFYSTRFEFIYYYYIPLAYGLRLANKQKNFNVGAIK